MSEETLRIILILCIAFVVQWVDRKRRKRKKVTSPVLIPKPTLSRLYRHSLRMKQLRQTVRTPSSRRYQTKEIVTYKL